jgi:hypothetical protein
MKRIKRIIEIILKARFETVINLKPNLYLVEHAEKYIRWWGIYSSREKGVVCYGDKYTVLSPDLVSFETRRSGSESLFSLSRERVVTFDRYRGYRFESQGKGWVKGLFLKDEEQVENIGSTIEGTGIYDISREDFVVQPEYNSLIGLGDGLYYGTKVERKTKKETYFLIWINEKGDSKVEKVSKIA